MRKRNYFIIAAILIILLPLLLSIGLDREKSKSRTFNLQHRELSEITGKIKPLLSPQGTILIRPQARQIVVNDWARNLDAIAKLIEQLDIPPREINLDIYFIDASRGAGKEKISFRIKEMAARLGSFLNYDHYQLIDSHRIKAKEGDTITISLGEQYIISFYTQLTDGAEGVIKLKNFRLFKRKRLATGRYRLKKLLVAAVNLIDGCPSIIGASSSEESNRALIMALTASILEE